jgi:SAM-dependent methyltransferase
MHGHAGGTFELPPPSARESAPVLRLAVHLLGGDRANNRGERGNVSDEGSSERSRPFTIYPTSNSWSGTGATSMAMPTRVGVIHSFIVFQHIPEPAITYGYIREIGRVLAPGGWALFQVSELPDIHRTEAHRVDRTARTRIRQLFGRQPRGCLTAEWLGSAVRRVDLLRALEEGGLEFAGSVGDGTQYCFVHAVKGSGPGASASGH